MRMILLRNISLKITSFYISVLVKRKIYFYLLNNFYVKLKLRLFLLISFCVSSRCNWKDDQEKTEIRFLKSRKIHFSINLSARHEELLKRLIVTLNTRTIKSIDDITKRICESKILSDWVINCETNISVKIH